METLIESSLAYRFSWYVPSFDIDRFLWDLPSFDTDLFSCGVPSFDTDSFLWDSTQSLAFEEPYRSDAPNDKVRYRDFFRFSYFGLYLRLKNRLRSDAPNDKGEQRYKFKTEYYQTAKFVQMLSESYDSACLIAKLMESRKSNHCARGKKSRKSNHCAKRKKSRKSNHCAKRKKSRKSNHRAKLMKSKNLFDDGGQVKRHKFKREYYQMPKPVGMLSEEFNDKGHAIQIPNQTSHGGSGQIKDQLVDPDGSPVKSARANLTGGAVSTAINPSPQDQAVNSAGDLEAGTSSSLPGSQTPPGSNSEGDAEATPPGGSNNSDNGVNSEGNAEGGTPSPAWIPTPPGGSNNDNNGVSNTESNDGGKVDLHVIENGFILVATVLSAVVSAEKNKSEGSLETKFLEYSLAVCCAVGLICFCYGLCASVYEKHEAGQLLRITGIIASALSMLIVAGNLFPSEARLEATVVLIVACALPMLGIARKFWC